MGPNVAALTLTFLCCNFATGSHVWINRPIPENQLNSLKNNPAIKNAIINAVLISRGINPGEIHDIINASNGDVEKAVAGINAALKQDILRIEDEKVKVDPTLLKVLFKEAIENIFGSKLQNHPSLEDIRQRVNSQSNAFDAEVAESAVSLENAKSLVENRKRRSLEPRFLETIPGMIFDVLFQLIGGPIKALLNPILDLVKNLLVGLLIEVEPDFPLLPEIMGFWNSLILKIINLITSLQEKLGTLGSDGDGETVARRKRETGEVVPVDDVKGLLDGIIGPILSLLSTITEPLNDLIKGLVNQIFSGLEGMLGSIVTNPIKQFIISIIDMLLPRAPQ